MVNMRLNPLFTAQQVGEPGRFGGSTLWSKKRNILNGSSFF